MTLHLECILKSKIGFEREFEFEKEFKRENSREREREQQRELRARDRETQSVRLTVLFGTIDAEEMVVSPENSVPVFHLCLFMYSRTIHTRSVITNKHLNEWFEKLCTDKC